MSDGNVLKEIGARINLKRKELGMTQEQLAEKMDVSVQMISNLEQGKKAIRPENLIKLCDALNVSSDYILRNKKSDFEKAALLGKYLTLSPEHQELVDRIINSWVK